MKTLLAISPHLDDAVFSAGATIALASRSGWRTLVATVFTGNVARPTGFALACQLDKGLAPDVDYMAIRRAEDVAACTLVGAEAIHLPLLEAPHRGYDSAAALFATILAEDKVGEAVAAQLQTLIAEVCPDRLMAPLGLGGHVDHLIVREAVIRANASARCYLWEDWPYAERVQGLDRSGARRVRASDGDRESKLAACTAYRTQIGFQFGGRKPLADLLARQSGEWFHPAPIIFGGRPPVM